MIDEKFALSEFEKERGDRRALRARADILADEIAQELNRALITAIVAIVEKLNRLGHNLRPYDTGEPEHIAFRDDEEDESGYDCKLRVAYDSTVSTGYADVLYSKSNPEGLYPEQVRDKEG
jgi:hypothetical protein